MIIKLQKYFKIMEKKIIFIYNDTSHVFIMDIWIYFLIHLVGFEQLGQIWMILKIVFVIIAHFLPFIFRKILKQFNIDQNTHSHKFYRIINEIPTILLILIVFVVIFKPL